MHRLTEAAVPDQAAGEIWMPGPARAPMAALFLTPKAGALRFGKRAVARVELTGNRATFARLGFTRVGATARPGHDRITSWT